MTGPYTAGPSEMSEKMPENMIDALADAALVHVPFEGWSEVTFRAALADCGVDPALGRALCPRGALDLAVVFHRRGDALMLERIARTDLSALRFRDRIAAAVRFRLQATPDREVLRRGAALFALPVHAPIGAQLIWDTADHIWSALGDSSDDLNWYTKRSILAGVYSSTLLFMLGDASPRHEETWAFLDRRIDNVMQFERAKATINANPLFRRVFAVPLSLLGRIRAPAPVTDLPGRWSPPSRK